MSNKGTAERRVRVADPVGIHLRVASHIVNAVHPFSAAVHVNGADARSMIALLKLAAAGDSEVLIEASGEDAAAAVDAVAAVLEA